MSQNIFEHGDTVQFVEYPNRQKIVSYSTHRKNFISAIIFILVVLTPFLLQQRLEQLQVALGQNQPLDER